MIADLALLRSLLERALYDIEHGWHAAALDALGRALRLIPTINPNYTRDTPMTRGLSTTLPTALPARYERLFAWALDRRCKAVRDVAADLFELWQDLGGVENLSVQKRWLCERVVYLRRRCLAYEAAVLNGTEPPMDAGTYSNHANVLQGYLRSLGLERKSRPVRSLHEVMAEAPSDEPATYGEDNAAPEGSNEATEGGGV